jgi:transcriptional regulator with XRE-family HTH domain
MVQRLKIYLRTLRRRSGLTQREFAFLLGLKHGATVSRLERLKRAPSLAWARTSALVFGTRAPELFPGLFSEIHEAVRHRANKLYEELQGDSSKATRAKLDFLEGVLARLEEARLEEGCAGAV